MLSRCSRSRLRLTPERLRKGVALVAHLPVEAQAAQAEDLPEQAARLRAQVAHLPADGLR